MKKLLLIHNFYREFGGEDSNLKEEIAFLNSSFETMLYSESNAEKLNIADYYSYIFRSNPKSNRKLKKILIEYNPSTVYIHNTWFKVNLGIFKILNKKKINTVVKIHNFRYFCASSFFAKNHFNENLICHACGNIRSKNRILNKYYSDSYLKSFILIYFTKKLQKIILQNNIKVIAISKFHKMKLLNSGFKDDNIFVIPNPVLTRDHKLKNVDSKNIVYAGRLTGEKGIEELLFNWSKIKKNYNLQIIGEGHLKKTIEKKYREYKNIEFLGFLNNEDTLDCIRNARAVITATKLFEGQPRLLCEATSLGVLSIYPSFGGMDELFPTNYKFSFEQFNYKNMVEKINLLDDSKLVSDESKRLQDFSLNFFKPSKVLNLYKKVL